MVITSTSVKTIKTFFFILVSSNICFILFFGGGDGIFSDNIHNNYDDNNINNTLLLLGLKPMNNNNYYNNNDVCCDAGSEWPGRKPNYPDCHDHWWICGFGFNSNDMNLKSNSKNYDPFVAHQRLVPYQFIRLSQGSGTGLVSLAGNEQGRQCIPGKNKVCMPKDKSRSSESSLV